jgi:hypothetical protein
MARTPTRAYTPSSRTSAAGFSYSTVSGDQLFPAASPVADRTSGNPILSEVARVDLPRIPTTTAGPTSSISRSTETVAYAALGRAGIGVFDISVPLHPDLVEVLDTPGLAMGIRVQGRRERPPPNAGRRQPVRASACTEGQVNELRRIARGLAPLKMALTGIALFAPAPGSAQCMSWDTSFSSQPFNFTSFRYSTS